MSEPVYITISEAERDLILNAFGGVRKERLAEVVRTLRDVETYLDSYIDELREADIHAAYSQNMLARVRSALATATQTQEGE